MSENPFIDRHTDKQFRKTESAETTEQDRGKCKIIEFLLSFFEFSEESSFPLKYGIPLNSYFVSTTSESLPSTRNISL